MKTLLWVVGVCLIAPGDVGRVGRLDEPAIREASGIAASRRHPGIFWVHNDSGNPPELFAVRRDGSLVRRYRVAMPNVDWEDIAADGDGHLFLGDIGNNGGRLPLRVIHRLDEPDPADESGAAKPLAVTLSTYYAFSPDDRFDAESLFVTGKHAFIIAKRFDGRAADLFRLPIDPPARLLRPARPEPVGTLPNFHEPATGAALSPDGKRLAVCALKTVRVYQKEGGGWRPVGEKAFRADGVEAVTWDGEDLLLAGEGRDLIRVRRGSWLPAPDGKP